MSVTVRLNGSNYVSEKTRQAFEKALADGHQIKSAAPVQPSASRRDPDQGPGQELAVSAALPPLVIAKEQEPTMPTLADYSRLLDSLDHGLAQAHEHQSQTLHVHEQYLSYQAEYAKLFTQLLQQQGDVFAHGQLSPQQAELAARVLDNLSHSMARFHDLQSETLNVHKHFLDQQAEYSQGQVDLLRQQSALTGAATPAHPPKPLSHHGGPSRESSHGERREIHRSHSHHGGNGHGNGNGNGANAHPVAAVEAAPVIHAPIVTYPRTSAKPLSVASQPVAKASPPPAVPRPAAQAPASAARPSPVLTPVAPTVSTSAPALDAAQLTSSLLAIVSDKTGYPSDMLELSMDMEADLGIDSIKRVEIMGALQERHPDLPKVEPQALAELRTLGQIVSYVAGVTGSASAALSEAASLPPLAPQGTPELAPAAPAAAPTADGGALMSSLLAIVSEKTGYPADMLELSMDMEADLGIDSIKRVEIMGALQERHPDLPKIEPAALAELRTLGQIVSFISAEPAAKKA